MKCMTWNCREWLDFTSNFNFLCSGIKLDLFCIFETKMDVDKVSRNFL